MLASTPLADDDATLGARDAGPGLPSSRGGGCAPAPGEHASDAGPADAGASTGENAGDGSADSQLSYWLRPDDSDADADARGGAKADDAAAAWSWTAAEAVSTELALLPLLMHLAAARDDVRARNRDATVGIGLSLRAHRSARDVF